MRGRKVIVLCIVGAMFLLVACSPDNGAGDAQTLRVATDAEPGTFDWHQSTSGATQSATIQVLETLYSLDENYAPVPMLAESEPQVTNGGLTYVIPVRDDVTFHDGTSLDAQDVAASLERWGEVSSNGRSMFAQVDEVTATDDHEVTIVLSEPYDVVRALAVPIAAAAIMPRDIVEQYGSDVIEDVTDLVGSGPYRMVEWAKGRHYTMERFDDYTPADNGADGGLAAARPATYERVEVALVQDASTRYQSTSSGQYDVALNLPGDIYDEVEASGLTTRVVSPYYSQYLLLDTSEPPFDDPEVRRAVALALDEPSLAMAAYGHEDLFELNGAIYPVDMGVLSTEAGIDKYGEQNTDEASALLEASDYDGEPVVWMTSQALAPIYNFSIAAGEQLEAVGFNVEIDVTEWAAMNDRYTQPETWDMFSTAFGVGYAMPSFHLLLNGQFPYEDWYAYDDEMADLLTAWHTAESESEQSAVMAQIQTQFYGDRPAIKLADYAAVNGISPDVSLEDQGFYLPLWWNAEPA
ncbi:ABC transporter substrate-binding protein [Aeromicrobium sp. CTD01-1L150]|uniref:ABC transporter substrate-binding protein n=1 Tax=Aeromicrobium sp. CTD01-1L150 TaxID=3341830 RepID=UPI0035BFB3A9